MNILPCNMFSIHIQLSYSCNVAERRNPADTTDHIYNCLYNHWTHIIIIIIHEFHRDASLEQNFRAAMCHTLHYSCNVNAAVADSLRWRMSIVQ